MIEHEPLDLGGRVPLVVAVTGHRHIRGEQRGPGKPERTIDEPALAASVREVLLQLLVDPDRLRPQAWAGPEALDPARPPSERRVTPVVVLNALAEGADRLVADVVLDLRAEFPEQLGDQLFQVFVSPTTLADYMQSFGGTDDPRTTPEQFAELVAACDHAYELPAMEAPRAAQPDGVSEPMDPTLCAHTAEEESYRRLGAYFVRNAHVLLALTDRTARLAATGGRLVHGDETSRPAVAAAEITAAETPSDPLEGLPTGDDGHDGGTTTVLSWFLGGLPTAYEPGALTVDRPPTRVAVELWEPAQRQWGERPAEPVFETGGRLAELLVEFETFNRDVRAFQAEQARAGQLARDAATARRDPSDAGDTCADEGGDDGGTAAPLYSPLTPDGGEGLSPPERQLVREALARMGPLVHTYDAADALATKWMRPRREDMARRLFAISVASILCIQGFGLVPLGVLLCAYLGGLLALWIAWQLLRRQRLEEKRITYRSLAESLRVQVALRHAGVSTMVSNEFARHSLEDIGWVREALRGLFVCAAPRRPGSVADEHGAVDRVRTAWVQDQGGTRCAGEHLGVERRGLGAGALALLSWFDLNVETTAVARRRLRARFDASAAREHRPLSDELGWFERKALLELEPAQRAWQVVTTLLVALGVGGAVLLFVLRVGDPLCVGTGWAAEPPLQGWTRWLALSTGPLLALAALCNTVSRVEAYEPLARHYREMARIFRRANEALERRHGPQCPGLSADIDLARRRRVLADLAREALGDEVRWNQLFRSRPLEISPP